MKPLTLPGEPTQGWLVLIGGGEFSFGDTREIDEFLISKMPSANRTIAFLPTASGSSEYAGHLAAYFKGIHPELSVTNVPIYRPRDARREKNLRALEAAAMIYLGGGVTNTFVRTLRESPAEETLRRCLAGGTVVAAIGSSAAALGSYCRDMETPGGALRGLSWLPETAIEAGFDPGDDARLRRLTSFPEVTLGLGIPAKTALAISPERRGEIVGNGSLAVVRKAGAVSGDGE